LKTANGRYKRGEDLGKKHAQGSKSEAINQSIGNQVKVSG
jgi:hypothetical protein